MKQKLIYSVLVVVSIYLPASSRECSKACLVTEVKKELPVQEKIPFETDGQRSLPISPFVSWMLNM